MQITVYLSGPAHETKQVTLPQLKAPLDVIGGFRTNFWKDPQVIKEMRRQRVDISKVSFVMINEFETGNVVTLNLATPAWVPPPAGIDETPVFTNKAK